jgi:Bacteriophage HK97-gp10, putative tail-component
MASGKSIFIIDGLDEFQRKLIKAGDRKQVDAMKSRILRTVGLRGLEHLDDLTPVGASGDLKKSMNMGAPGNVFEVQVGKQSYVLLGTNIKYAQYVNDGFTQEKGRFVPGEWSGNTFHYIPGHDEGMVLTGKTIPGAFMFEKMLDRLDTEIDRAVQFEFRRTFGDLMG